MAAKVTPYICGSRIVTELAVVLPARLRILYNDGGRACVPVGALVFKISGRRCRAGCGGFDSHAFPPPQATALAARGIIGTS